MRSFFFNISSINTSAINFMQGTPFMFFLTSVKLNTEPQRITFFFLRASESLCSEYYCNERLSEKFSKKITSE